MVFSVSILLTVLFVHMTVAQTSEPCCMTTNLRGQRFYVEDQIIEYFEFDFSAQKLYYTRDPAGDVFEIIDLKEGRLYNFNGDRCSFQTSIDHRRFPQCVTNQGQADVQFQMGSTENPRNVRVFSISNGNFEAFLALTTRNPSICAPLITQLRGPSGSKTTIYSHVRPSIRDLKIYTKLDSCFEQSVVPRHPVGHCC